MKPSASKTRRMALSLVLSAANVVVVVSTVRSTAGQTVFPLVPRTRCAVGRDARAGLAECCRLTGSERAMIPDGSAASSARGPRRLWPRTSAFSAVFERI
jgi:hypothetical protein